MQFGTHLFGERRLYPEPPMDVRTIPIRCDLDSGGITAISVEVYEDEIVCEELYTCLENEWAEFASITDRINLS